MFDLLFTADSLGPRGGRMARAVSAAAIACAVLTGLSAPAWAQSAPGSAVPAQAAGGEGGTVERSRSLVPRPAPVVDGRARPDWFAPPTIDPATSQTTFPLKTVKVQGVTALPHAQIEALIEPYRGREVSLAELQALANSITRLYAERGYGLSFAVVPEQDVKDGIVRLVAVEVFIDRVTVEMTQKSAAVIGPRRIRELLERQASRLKDERPVSVRHIEAMVLALNDLPGVKASVNIRRGARGQGASQLVLQVEASAVAFELNADNRLRADFGREEFTVQTAFRSLGLVGDELALSASHSARARDFAFYSARYQAPVLDTSLKAYLTYPFVLSWSLMEAMSAGAPVVGSATAPVQEVIRHGENGLLADFFSPEEIADRVCQVLAGGAEIEALRQRARQTIIRDYDLTRVCLPRLADFYGEVTGAAPGLAGIAAAA